MASGPEAIEGVQTFDRRICIGIAVDFGPEIVALASQGEVPSRLIFGDDARQWTAAKVEELRHDIAWSADKS